MSILIGGGSGFVGGELSKLLVKNGLKVILVSRSAGSNKITWKDLEKNGLPKDCSGVVSMAGENILNPFKRWNEDFKSEVRSSRIDTTKALAQAIMEAENKPKVFVSMSGVAYHKPDDIKEYTEESSGGDYDFLSRLTTEWEAAAKLPNSCNVRQIVVRTGVVLGRNGGMIKQIYLPFYMGAGGKIGSGLQWFPWIHVSDVAGIFAYAIQNENVNGVLNAVAPNPVTNSQFTSSFAGAMWRPSIFPTPGFMMNALFGAERGKVILEGQKVLPKRTLEYGYKFKYPDIDSACKEIVC
ncbi:hypothetical protein SNE40_007507 [Patella caerulea]|uniref:Epimerase family protein SDR39U1 n=1 Tax=Patella caerulea TaxID=87958 RepID=A0AAN8JYM7_PATCE